MTTRSSELNRYKNYSGKNSEFGIESVKKITVTGKIAPANDLAIRNAKPYRINCFQN